MDGDTVADSALVVNKYVLSLMGQWPYQSNRARRIIRIITNSIMTVASVSSMVALYDVRDDFDAVVERIPMCMTGSLYYIYFFTLVIQTSKMGILLDEVKTNFRKIYAYSLEEFKILKEFAEQGQFVTLIYSLVILVSAVSFSFVALVPVALDFFRPINESRTRNYIYDADYIIFESEDHYYFVFWHSFIAGLYSIFTLVSFDLMLFIFLHHGCGMFQILGYRLQHIMENNDINYIITKQEYYKMDRQTKSCITLYHDIVDFIDNVEACFATCLTFTMGISAIILSFQGVMIVVRLDEPDFVMRCTVNFVAQAFHLFFNCYTGQMLINSSGNVLIDIHTSNWNQMPPKQQKLMLMMMARSLKDCKVTIGKFFILSVETYSALMRTVFSYLSVLTSVRASGN